MADSTALSNWSSYFTATSLFLGAAALAILLLARISYESVRDRRLPPGPRRYPFIGNLFQAPASGGPIWIFLKELADEYGPIFSVQIRDLTCIVLADRTHFHELLEKRGTNYSDRPRFVQANNLYQGRHILLHDYGKDLKQHKRYIKPVLDSRAAQTYAPVQESEARRLVVDLLSSNDFTKHLNRYSSSIVCTLAHGHRVESLDDSLLDEIYSAQNNTRKAFTLGIWAVDYLPSLNRLPKSLAPWKQTAEKWQHQEEAMRVKHLKTALQTRSWNWAKQLVANGKAIDRVEVAYDLGIMVDAGTEPSAAVLQVFVLAALLFPNFVAEAQKELDAVVGDSRSPTLADGEKLKYVHNCMKEVFRWRSVLPLAFPHQSHKEDEYMGYRIPAGSIIVPLQWYHNLNPNVYPEPQTFSPERWTSGCPEYYAFGFGLRQCPGMHVARDSIFLAMANIMWAFDISHGEGSLDDCADEKWNSGFLTNPPPFEARFTVRSPQHASVILREQREAEVHVDTLLAQVEGKMKWQR